MSYNNTIAPLMRKRNKLLSALTPVLIVSGIIAGLQTATQQFARTFDYQEALGPHLNHVYAPWSIIKWLTPSVVEQYQNYAMQATGTGLLVTTGFFLVAGMIRKLTRQRKDQYLHGSARWATKKDILNAGLLENDGVYVGGWINPRNGQFNYLRHNGAEHILCYAPTRSGKGVGLVIPTLLSWSQSAVITDLKGELWELTAGWRKQYANNKVLRFEPADPESVCWNPLDEIRLGTKYEVSDVQNLATILVDPDGKGMESHWDKTSYSLLVSVILHTLYKAKAEGYTASLATVDELFSGIFGGDTQQSNKSNIKKLWDEMLVYPHVDGKPHPAILSGARDMLDRPEEEGGSVLSTSKTPLILYRDPIVAKNTSRSDFKIKDLMNHNDPVSLYIITTPTDKDRMRPLVRVLLNMILRVLADRMEFENGKAKQLYKHKLLMMIDEFPSLGKLPIMQESLAFVAGYGIKCYLICQDISQLRANDAYGKDERITANCHVQVVFQPNKKETAEYISNFTGTTTVSRIKKTYSGRGLFKSISETREETQRPLLTTDECLRLPGPMKKGDEIVEGGDMLVYSAGMPAIYGKQPLFFKDPIFLARSKIPAPKTDVLHKKIDTFKM